MNLPADSIAIIFSFLKSRRDLVAASEICKQWRAVSLKDFVWQPLFKHTFGDYPVPPGKHREYYAKLFRGIAKYQQTPLKLLVFYLHSESDDLMLLHALNGWRPWATNAANVVFRIALGSSPLRSSTSLVAKIKTATLSARLERSASDLQRLLLNAEGILLCIDLSKHSHNEAASRLRSMDEQISAAGDDEHVRAAAVEAKSEFVEEHASQIAQQLGIEQFVELLFKSRSLDKGMPTITLASFYDRKQGSSLIAGLSADAVLRHARRRLISSLNTSLQTEWESLESSWFILDADNPSHIPTIDANKALLKSTLLRDHESAMAGVDSIDSLTLLTWSQSAVSLLAMNVLLSQADTNAADNTASASGSDSMCTLL